MNLEFENVNGDDIFKLHGYSISALKYTYCQFLSHYAHDMYSDCWSRYAWSEVLL